MDFETGLKDPQEVRMDILAKEVADLSVPRASGSVAGGEHGSGNQQ